MSRGSAATSQRILRAARASFASRGYDATSLDTLAAEIGVRKQTILYYHGSKDALLLAVVDDVAAHVTEVLEAAIDDRHTSSERVRAIVDAAFRMGAARPELLELVREFTRLGPPASARLGEQVQPLLDRAASFVAADSGFEVRRDPGTVVLTASAMVLGMVTEAELLRSFGVSPDRGWVRRRRRALLSELGVDAGAGSATRRPDRVG